MSRPDPTPLSLCAAFLPAGAAGDAALEAALAATLASAQEAWPAVALPGARAAFLRHLGEKVAPGEDARAALPALRAADLYLAWACAEHDAAALSAFEQRFIAEVPALIRRAERSPAAVAEVQQALRERLFVAGEGARPKILEYAGRGPLMSWLRVVALRTLSNLRRGARPAAEADAGTEDEAAALPGSDPELLLLRKRCGAAFEAAFRAAFAALPLRERGVLRHHLLDGLSIDRIAAVQQVHRATAARRLAAARERLFADTLRRLREDLRLAPAEMASLEGFLRSQLEVSLRGLLAEPAPPDGEGPAG